MSKGVNSFHSKFQYWEDYLHIRVRGYPHLDQVVGVIGVCVGVWITTIVVAVGVGVIVGVGVGG